MGEEKKEGFKFPTLPQIFAGGVGGPMVFYTVTPARNALTIASSDINLSIAGCYGQVHAAVFFLIYTSLFQMLVLIFVSRQKDRAKMDHAVIIWGETWF